MPAGLHGKDGDPTAGSAVRQLLGHWDGEFQLSPNQFLTWELATPFYHFIYSTLRAASYLHMASPCLMLWHNMHAVLFDIYQAQTAHYSSLLLYTRISAPGRHLPQRPYLQFKQPKTQKEMLGTRNNISSLLNPCSKSKKHFNL